MAVKQLQRSFAGGEVSPELYGRLDLARYQTALALCRNARTLPHGPAENRAGFEYILETKDSTKQSVLLPFSFNDQQTYILEFGNQYIRFHTQGGTLLEAAQSITAITQANPGVVTKNAHGYNNGDWLYLVVVGMTQLSGRFVKVANKTANTFELTSIHGGANINTTAYGAFVSGTMARVYEVASPYLEADLFELHIAQSADVLTITHNDYPPAELSRLSATSWAYAAIAFTNGPFLDAYSDKRKYMWTADVNGALPPLNVRDGTTGDISIYSDDDVFVSTDVGRLIWLKYSGLAIKGVWETGKSYGAGTYVQYGDQNYLALTSGTSGTVPPTHTFGARLDAQGAGGVLWLYTDSNFGVAKIISFVSTKEVKAEVQTGLPLNVQFGYVNAGKTAHTPTTTWTLSGTGSQTQFAIAGATGYTPYCRVKVNGVRQIPFEEYSIDPTTDKIDFFVAPPAGANNIVVEEFAFGVFTVDFAFGAWGVVPGYPAAVSYFGGRIGYGGSKAEPTDVWLSRATRYKDFGRTFDLADDEAIDLRIADRKVNAVRDLVPLRQLVAMTASRAWAVVGDVDNVLTPTATVEPGSAIGISTVQAEVVGAHALFVDSTGNGVRKLRYGTSPDGTEGYIADDLSVLAEHLLRNKTIVDIAFQQKPYPTLWLVRSDGVLLALSYSPEQDVVGWHQHDTDGYFESVAVINEGTEDSVYAVVRRTINGRTARYVERMRSRRFVSLADCFHVDAGDTYSGVPVTTITGLHHLEGEAVAVLADGAVITGKTVSGGAIELDIAASKVHVGLPFTSDLKTLPLAMQIQAFAQGTQKNVSKAFLRLIDSSGIKAGPDFDTLTELPQRTDETYGSPEDVMNGLREVTVEGTWTDDGQICVRQDKPLPLTVSAMVLEVALGG